MSRRAPCAPQRPVSQASPLKVKLQNTSLQRHDAFGVYRQTVFPGWQNEKDEPREPGEPGELREPREPGEPGEPGKPCEPDELSEPGKAGMAMHFVAEA